MGITLSLFYFPTRQKNPKSDFFPRDVVLINLGLKAIWDYCSTLLYHFLIESHFYRFSNVLNS